MKQISKNYELKKGGVKYTSLPSLACSFLSFAFRMIPPKTTVVQLSNKTGQYVELLHSHLFNKEKQIV